MNEKIIKDLELIKWNVEHNKEKSVILQIIDIIAKRYGGLGHIPEVVDPASVDTCDGCQ